jgi:hypothetical protein
MMRNVIAVVVGLVAGMAVNMAIVMLNTKVLFPMPEGLDWEDKEGFAAYLGTLPWTAFVVVIAAHLGQSFFGGLVAARMSKNKPMLVALIVGALTMIGGLMMLNSTPHPTWMWIEVPLYIVTAWAAGNLVITSRTSL